MSNILRGLNEGRSYGRDSWDSNMPGYQGDYGGAENFGRRNREWDEDDRIDARIRAENEKKREYEQNGKFWLKFKDSQRHLPAGPFIGKQAANTAAIELLKQQPELKGNLLITAYGPDETQGVAEGSLNEDKGFDVVKSLVSAFNDSVSGDANIPLAAERPGSRVFTRSDGTRYRDHGNIRFYQGYIDPQDVAKWKATKPVEKFWDWLTSQSGVKPIGQVSGEFRQDPMRDAVAYKGLYFVLTPHGSVIWGSVSRFKNPNSVWRQQDPKQDVAEGQLDELSNKTLASYKKKAGADATQADKRGDYARGNKRMSGIIKATKKEFDNDAKSVNEEELDENLNKWFKEKWVRFGPDGKIRGDCARGDDSEGKPKCLPQSKAQNLGKEGRASAASRKRREDPNPERSGKAINVNTKKKSNEGVTEEQLDEKCWDTHKQVGMKNKGGKQVPNCVPKESIEESRESCPECGGPMFSDMLLAEKQDACYNKVKSRYKVWPSAYASGALVQCRKKGADNWGTGGKKSESAIMKGLVDETLGTPYPGTYEQEMEPFKRKGQQQRVQKIAFEGKK